MNEETKQHGIWAIALTFIALIICSMIVGSVRSCNEAESEHVKAGFVWVPSTQPAQAPVIPGHWEKVKPE